MASPICQLVICITCEIPGLFGDVIRCNPKAKKTVMKSKALHRLFILLSQRSANQNKKAYFFNYF